MLARGLLANSLALVCRQRLTAGKRFFSGEVKERALKLIKPRALITHENAPHRVTKIQQGKRGKGGGFVKALLKNLISGSTFEKTYTSDEMVEGCNLEKIPCTYSWKDGHEFVMMHETTFEEYRIEQSIISGEDKYLVEGEAVRLLRFQGKPIGVELPNVMEFTVVSMSGREGRGGTSLATLNSGATVMVPDFISEGQRIKVNTVEDTYQERA